MLKKYRLKAIPLSNWVKALIFLKEANINKYSDVRLIDDTY